MSVPSKPNIDSMSQAETSAEENQVKTKDISGALETPEFPVEQTALLAYSGNSRQRRKAWRQDARRIIEACRDAGIGTTVGDGKTIHVSDLIGHVCEVRAK